jgi:hypothetical protein
MTSMRTRCAERPVPAISIEEKIPINYSPYPLRINFNLLNSFAVLCAKAL